MSKLYNDNEFDKIFRDGLHDLEGQPSERVWLAVQNEVGTGAKGFLYYLRIPAAACILLLASYGLYSILNPGTIDSNTPQYVIGNETNQVFSPQDHTPIQTDLEQSNNGLSYGHGGTNPPTSSHFAVGTHASDGAPQNTVSQNDEDVSKLVFDFPPFHKKPNNILDYILKPKNAEKVEDKNVHYPVPDATPKGETVKPLFALNDEPTNERTSGFYFGPVVNYNNNWLRNVTGEPNNGERFEDLDAVDKPGSAVGVGLGYRINKRSTLEMDYYLNSREKQEYHSELTETIYNVNLKYQRIPLLFKYNVLPISSNESREQNIQTIVGLQFGFLEQAEVDENIFLDQETFNKREFGFVLGLEYDISFDEKYMLTLGSRGSINTSTENIGNLRISESDSPYNLLLGLTAGFNYLF